MRPLKKIEGQIGRPALWTKRKVLQQVRKLCKKGYVKTADFSPALYKATRIHFGSVRRAKWEAGILKDTLWTYKKFIQSVQQFCGKRYKENKDWPPALKELARRYCGTIRRAKWEARIIQEPRTYERTSHKMPQGNWTKKKFLAWVRSFCQYRYRKVEHWPAHMRTLALQYFSSVRAAKFAAGVLKESRKKKR